jgi:hypothetical protein
LNLADCFVCVLQLVSLHIDPSSYATNPTQIHNG